jgi:Cu/Ag efflux protein CusF
MKKLLVATSALVVAAPAMAQPTLSGSIVAKATTTGLTELSGGAISTLTLKVAYEGDNLGGDMSFGDTGTPDLSAVMQMTGFNVYADTTMGKFNIGTSQSKVTDDDLTELSIFNDKVKNVDMPSMTGEAVQNDTFFLTHSKPFYGADVAISWGDTAANVSVSTDMGDFKVMADMNMNGDSAAANAVAPYVINVTGDLGPVGLKLESGYSAVSSENDGTDIALSFDANDLTIDFATGSNGNADSDITEFRVSGSMDDISYAVAMGSNDGLTTDTDFSEINLKTMMNGMGVGLNILSYDGADTTEIYVEPMSGIEIEYVDVSTAADAMINFKIEASF